MSLPVKDGVKEPSPWDAGFMGHRPNHRGCLDLLSPKATHLRAGTTRNPHVPPSQSSSCSSTSSPAPNRDTSPTPRDTGHLGLCHPSNPLAFIPRSVLELLPRQSLGSPNSRWSCPSSFPAPWKWIFTLFHSLRKQQMRGMGLNLNPIVAGNEAEINQDYSIPAGLTWSIQNLPVPLPGASRAQGAVSRP